MVDAIGRIFCLSGESIEPQLTHFIPTSEPDKSIKDTNISRFKPYFIFYKCHATSTTTITFVEHSILYIPVTVESHFFKGTWSYQLSVWKWKLFHSFFHEYNLFVFPSWHNTKCALGLSLYAIFIDDEMLNNSIISRVIMLTVHERKAKCSQVCHME